MLMVREVDAGIVEFVIRWVNGLTVIVILATVLPALPGMQRLPALNAGLLIMNFMGRLSCLSTAMKPYRASMKNDDGRSSGALYAADR